MACDITLPTQWEHLGFIEIRVILGPFPGAPPLSATHKVTPAGALQNNINIPAGDLGFLYAARIPNSTQTVRVPLLLRRTFNLKEQKLERCEEGFWQTDEVCIYAVTDTYVAPPFDLGTSGVVQTKEVRHFQEICWSNIFSDVGRVLSGIAAILALVRLNQSDGRQQTASDAEDFLSRQGLSIGSELRRLQELSKVQRESDSPRLVPTRISQSTFLAVAKSIPGFEEIEPGQIPIVPSLKAGRTELATIAFELQDVGSDEANKLVPVFDELANARLIAGNNVCDDEAWEYEAQFRFARKVFSK